MKHPEDLISFLYNEVSDERKMELASHLETCAECRARVAEWQKVKEDLTAWKLPSARRKPFAFAAGAKWAAAAVLMVGIGFGLGRFNASDADAKTLRAEIEAKLQASFQEQLAAARQTDRQEVIVMLRDIEEQRLTDYIELRQDLETVAVIADEKLTSTERALSQLNLVAQSESENTTTE
jgi:hypothetical protein